MNDKRILLTKPIFSSITLFALPMLAGNILQQLYNIVDTWVVGNYIGVDALAAVGAVFALMIFLTSVLIGLCMGSGIVFSLCFGENQPAILERRIMTSFLGIGTLTLLITALSFFFISPLLRWMNIPIKIQVMTGEYLRIILLGIPAVFLYNFFAGYLKALGNSLIPLIFLGFSAVSNIALDLVFVISLHLGVSGVAIATVIAQYLSAIACTVYCLITESHLRTAFSRLDIRREDLIILGRYSLFTCMQQSVMNFGILIVQGIVNSFGTSVMAAFAAGVKIDAFAYMPAQEYGNAFSTFLAQNYGAGDTDRVRKGIRCGILTSSVYCVLASSVLYFFAEPLMSLFVDTSRTEILAVGVGYLHIEGVFYIGIGILFLWYGLYRALGHPEMSLVLTIISLGTRVLLAKLSAASSIGVIGIWWAIPIGWFLADLVGALCYKTLLRSRLR